MVDLGFLESSSESKNITHQVEIDADGESDNQLIAQMRRRKKLE